MAVQVKCGDCPYSFPRGQMRCPHCGRPSLFPNVQDAEDDPERDALEHRYQDALRDALARGCDAQIGLLKAAIESSRAVINRPVGEAERLSARDTELYASFYQMINGKIRIPAGEKWDKLRMTTDSALFGDTKDEIRFAALTLDDIGLDNYGACSLILNTAMIAHRASTFEENSVKFMGRRGIKIAEVDDLPRGFRATWEERGKLCVAKLAARIDATMTHDKFPELLLKQGATSEDDDFIEVHIMGPMTIRTFEKVVVRRKKNQPRKAILNALRERLQNQGVDLQEL